MTYPHRLISYVLTLCILAIPLPIHSTDQQTSFISAIKWGDTPKISELLQRGADVNRPDEEAFTPLCWAAAGGRKDVVNLLLEAGAQVNQRGQFGVTALICAAGWGHVEIVKRLIESGADVNLPDERGLTALTLAAVRGRAEMVKLLVEHGAKPGANPRGRGSPVIGAAQYGHTNVVDLFLAAGAEINERNHFGRTPLMTAAYRGRYETTRLLLDRGAEINLKDVYGNTALMLATRVGHKGVVEALLEKGADSRIRNDKGMTAIAVASERGDTEVMRLLAAHTKPDVSPKENRDRLDRTASEPQGLPYDPPTTAADVVAEVPNKICQIVGEYDRERGRLTANRTLTRYGLSGTDLGVPFEHKGRTYLLFGDSNGIHGGDCVAHSNDTNLDDGLHLDFVADENGSYKAVEVPGISQGDMEVPVEGVSVNGTMYTYHTTDFSTKAVIGRTVVAVSRDDGRTFEYLYDLSRKHFLNVSVVKKDVRERKSALGSADTGLFIFGSGEWRKSDVRLAFQPSSGIESPESIRYFAGLDGFGKPVWSPLEGDVKPLFHQSCVGELSAAYVGCMNKWLILYNCGSKDFGVYMRTADHPWGPWSEPQLVYEPSRDPGLCRFMHQTWESKKCDILQEPGRENFHGVVYGPYIFENHITGDSRSATIYFTLSTWNPYTVVLMKTALKRID
jgi:ankyrin repeat protein